MQDIVQTRNKSHFIFNMFLLQFLKRNISLFVYIIMANPN